MVLTRNYSWKEEVFSNGRVEVSDTSYGKIRYEEALVVDDCFQKRNQKRRATKRIL
jgi:hypothetical protein